MGLKKKVPDNLSDSTMSDEDNEDDEECEIKPNPRTISLHQITAVALLEGSDTQFSLLGVRTTLKAQDEESVSIGGFFVA